MAQIFGSISITSMLAPTDSADTYSVYEDIYNRGGYRTVTTNADLMAITRPRRKLGMMVYVTDTGKAWILKTEPHSTWDLQTSPQMIGDTHLAPYVTFTGAGGDTVAGNTDAFGDWIAFEPGGGNFTAPIPTELSLGGVNVGYSFTNVSFSDMWNTLLFPTDFLTFGLTGYSSYVLEAGVDSIAANATFEWSNYHDALISGSGSGPDFNITATTAGDFITNPSVQTYGATAASYTSTNTVFNGAITEATDAMHEYTISLSTTYSQTFSKVLKVYWRHPFYIGTIGYGSLGMFFLDIDNSGGTYGPPTAPVGTNTLANALANNLTWGTGAVYGDAAIQKHLLDPDNFDYSTLYSVPDTTGNWFASAAPSGEFRCIIMPQAYFSTISGGAFTAGSSTITFHIIDGTGSELGPLVMHNTCALSGTNLVWTDGGINYIGFETDGRVSGAGAANIRIISFNP